MPPAAAVEVRRVLMAYLSAAYRSVELGESVDFRDRDEGEPVPVDRSCGVAAGSVALDAARRK